MLDEKTWRARQRMDWSESVVSSTASGLQSAPSLFWAASRTNIGSRVPARASTIGSRAPARVSMPARARASTAVRALVSADEQLVERARKGDRDAFRALFMAHRGQVARLLMRLVPQHEIEDVAQEVFLQVHRSLDAFRGDARFSTWLYRLTLNVARMHLRRQKSRPKLAFAGADEAGKLEQPSLETPAHDAERHERMAALGRLLERLSEKKREALLLHDFQGISAEEVAKIVDAPVMTVRTRVFYARKELYAALADEPALAALLDTLAPSPRPAAVDAREPGVAVRAGAREPGVAARAALEVEEGEP
jgi:RNA polymerase sigma-70 factor (ECF subfamily)